ncbi:glycosyltransferase family 9 protein [Desulfogranum mediterraneum]|uniref:glycosyltransferase family 9 protein n=1 Tax=Desulfogranum mediterraneum TaxID=160661 RepID=UPI00042452AF|nr:glycosyltransferase family 9 protein [Desulfogranum mediterraneum]
MELSNKRLLLIKQSSLGDVIHALPVAHALKRHHPDCVIGWVVDQGFAGLVERDQAVDRVYPVSIPATSDPDAEPGVYFRALKASCSTLAALRREFRAAPYDLILDLHASFRSGLFSRMNPGGLRIGFADARELNTWFQQQHLENPEARVHALEKNLLFAEFLECPAGPEDYHLCLRDEDRQQAAEFLRSHQGDKSGPALVYANPAARWQTKFWAVESWALLADQLIASGLQVVFGGSPKDQGYIREIVSRMVQTPMVAAGRLTLPGSAALLERAGVYVGLDSGPMHIAAMVQTPVVALFGPTHPERVRPYGVEHRIVQAPGLDCLCCRQRSCSHRSCMKGISVAQVQGAVRTLLEGGCYDHP